MAQKYKNKDLLKIQPFYSGKIKMAKKRKRKIVTLKFLLKNLKN